MTDRGSMVRGARAALPALAIALFHAVVSEPARAEQLSLPILVPITGFLSIEGTSQRDGALLGAEVAAETLPAGLTLATPVLDTATAPETAVNAFLRAMREEQVIAVVAPLFGPQMLALLPLAEEFEVPLLTVSGTATITEQGNPWVFRFFPSDAVVKAAQARYTVEVLGARRPAILYQTTAYGQSGADALTREFETLGAQPVFSESFAPTVKDTLPILARARDARPDALVLQLHAASTALLIRQWAESGHAPPVIAGSALHQPTTAALLSPSDLTGTCAETGALPTGDPRAAMQDFRARFESRFARQPDAYAAAQYDAMTMAAAAIARGARTAEALRADLAAQSHTGIAMTYRNDGTGNMAHDALIVCYDGQSRVPAVAKRYPGRADGQ